MIRRLILELVARLPAPALGNDPAAVAAKRAQVARQLKECYAPHVRVTCGCGTAIRLSLAFRCLYCGEFYCQRCAEVHFGKTRAQYEHERGDLEHAA